MTSAEQLDPKSSSRVLASMRESERLFGAGTGVRATMPSLPTDLLSVSPEFLDALKTKVPPKRKRVRIRHIIALALLVVVGVLGADKSARELATEKGRAIVAHVHARASHSAQPAVAIAATTVSSASSTSATTATEPKVGVPAITVPTAPADVKAPKMIAPRPPKKRLNANLRSLPPMEVPASARTE